MDFQSNVGKGYFQMSTEITQVEEYKEHPLEEAFGIESGTTLTTHTERSTELVTAPQYDDKDSEIEDQFQEVYDAAMAAFSDQVAETEIAEGRYKARNMEVGVQLLSTALTAAKEKATQKQNKDKNEIDNKKIEGKGGLTQNNVFVGSHADLMKTVLNKTQKAPIEHEGDDS